MMDTLRDIQHLLMAGGLAALAILGFAAALRSLIGPMLAKALELARASVWRAAILGVFAGAFIFYGATKGKIYYPYTDYEKHYLTDAGSYVTNDLVHVAFTRIIAPSSADLHIDYRQWQSTNDADWVSLIDTTFAEFDVPEDIPFPAATNFDFAVYTTWTPGAAVQTNGVWHSYWGMDHKFHMYYIPVRTAVRVDDETIATPKSKENSK